MNKTAIDTGYVRINELLVKAIDSAKHGAKEDVYRLANTLMEDFDDYLALLYSAADITEQDIVKFSSEEISDEALIKMASHESEADISRRASK